MSHVLISTYMRWFNKVLILSIFCCSHTEAANALSQIRDQTTMYSILNIELLVPYYSYLSNKILIFTNTFWNETDREMIGKQNLKRVAWFDWGVPFEPFHARVTQFSNPWGESTFSKKAIFRYGEKKTSLIISLHCICTCSFLFSFFPPKCMFHMELNVICCAIYIYICNNLLLPIA